MKLTIAPALVSGPTDTPISLAEAKAHCNVEHSDDDTLITALISQATSMLDGWRGNLGRCLMNQTWKINLPAFPGDTIDLPLGNLVSITSVKYYDASNAQQTLSSAYYAAFQGMSGPYVKLINGYTWPSTYDRDDAIEIAWVAGFGATAADVPGGIRLAMLQTVAHWYENRSAVAVDEEVAEMPYSAEWLLAPYRLIPL